MSTDNNNWFIGEIIFFDNVKRFGFVKDVLTDAEYYVHIPKEKIRLVYNFEKVVFEIIPSKYKPGKFEAVNLTSLTYFKKDNEFLIKVYIEVKNFEFKKAILKQLPNNLSEFVFEQELLKNASISNENELITFKEETTKLFKLFVEILPSEQINEKIQTHLEGIVFEDYRIELWLRDIIKFEPNINLIVEYCRENNIRIEDIYKKLIYYDRKTLFLKSLVDGNDILSSIKILKTIIKLENHFDLQDVVVNAIISEFNNQKYNLEISEQSFNLVSDLINTKNQTLVQNLLDLLYRISADYIKLKFWLSDFINREDYDIYQSNFIFLGTSDQKKYIKKLFYLLSKKAVNISYDRISVLKNLIHSYSDGKKFKLDFSCHIILESIESVKSGSFLNEVSIFTILTKHIENDTASLITLNGFFEKCSGRSIPDATFETEEGQKSIVSLKKIPIPRNVEFCEGVRFGETGKDRTYQHDCWWCRSGSCYAANQLNELPTNYNDFTLATFFSILDIQFDKKEYYDFLGLLNKIEMFLKHLNCRSCNHILKPDKEGYYSYYRIANFVCSNPTCDNRKTVYLNHCLGAKKTAIKTRCDNLIDSRDTVRCNYIKHNPSNNYEKYGPYVCNLCGSCCSQKSLEKKHNELNERKWNMQPGLDWKVRNKVGHLENGEIFCYSCGTEMTNNEEEYKEFVSRLENPDSLFKVLKKGTNNYGFWFMVKADEVFFGKALEVGLRVSNTKGEDSNVKFIAQGNINFLICQNCNMKYNKTKAEFIILKDEAAS